MIKNLFRPSMNKRWLFTVANINGNKDFLVQWADTVYEYLDYGYNDSRRFYHSYNHIYDSLKKFEIIQSLLNDPISVELAIWFHDIVYDPLSKYNEDNSAELAHKLISQFDSALADKVAQLVMFTKWDQSHFGIKDVQGLKDSGIFTHASEDFFYLRDIDWSGFGSSWKQYNANTVAIRAECPYISNEEFKRNRTAFLSFIEAIERPLYCTEFYNERIGKSAKQNIKKDLKHLRQH